MKYRQPFLPFEGRVVLQLEHERLFRRLARITRQLARL